MKKLNKIKGRKRKIDGRSQTPASASPKRNVWLPVLVVILCLAIGAFYYLQTLARTKEESKETESPISSEEQPLYKPIPSELTPEQKVAALKKEELELAGKLISDFPNNVEALVLMGNVWERHGDAIEALKFWTRVLELDPKRSDVYKSIGWFAMQKGQYEEAIANWRKALEINPQIPDMHNSIAVALMGMGKQREAIDELEKDVQISPHSSFSYFMLGQGYLQEKEYEKAKKNYEKAIELAPSYTNAYYGLFTACTRLKQDTKAQEYLATFKKLKVEDMKILKDRNNAIDDLVNMQKGMAETYMHAGQIYRAKGNLQRTEELLKISVTLDPNNIMPLERLASLYQMTDHIPEALSLYKKINEIEPDNQLCYLNIGLLSAHLRKVDDAEEAFSKSIELAPNSSIGYRELAQLYLKVGKSLPEARKLAEKAVALEPIAINYFVLSWACDLNGDLENGLKAIEQAIQLEPGNLKYKTIYEHIKNRN